MYTQVTCPNCQTPFTAEVHQVVDAGTDPELKQHLLSGQLNIAVCPNCNMGGQMATALLFHDPEYEMFIVHVPQEMNMNQLEREKLIGQLSQQAMDALPPEKRRAYMLQPQIMLSRDSFMEKVLETEGITPEMIARQRRQAELLQTLARADKDVAAHLIKERIDEIDEAFFAILQAFIDTAAQANDGDAQLLALTNLRAKLMVDTPVGRQLEKQQIAMHALNRDAKKQDGLSPELLLKHILANQDDENIVDAIVTAGRGALNYSFFSMLSVEIERQEMAGNQKKLGRLTSLRERLLSIYDSMQEESKRIMAGADQTLQEIMDAPDKEAAVRANIAQIDDAFMYLLSVRIAEADKNGEASVVQGLNEIYTLIMKQVESQFPPEVVLLNQLMEADSNAERKQILDENQQLITPNLLKMLEAVSKEIQSSQQAEELDGRLESVKALIEARL